MCRGFVYSRRAITLVLALSVLDFLSGCGSDGSSGSPPAPPGTIELGNATKTVRLAPFHDEWPDAAPRWLDIANRPLETFINGTQTFSYHDAQVSLEYSVEPDLPFFTGRVIATGLKPNFAYQLKLAGKPVAGSRGWGEAGDDETNERLGIAGRWWCDTTQQHVGDEYYRHYYQNPPPARRRSVHGYLFIGILVTDAAGDADLTFRGDRSLHITWQEEQTGAKDIFAGVYEAQSTQTPPFYGYGQAMPRQPVKLWYEWEWLRAHTVQLPDGDYDCRFLLTEESFHGAGGANSGNWLTVLTSEPHSDSASPNAIAFTISR